MSDDGKLLLISSRGHSLNHMLNEARSVHIMLLCWPCS
jgi:hypothetical protein